MNNIQDLERLVAAIEKQGANIAPTYQEYMPLAFAIANDCGEAGRSLFHRICRISEKYVSDEADRLFDHALKGGNGRNGIGSVYHWAETAGVKLDKQLAGTARSYAGKQPETCELANLRSVPYLTHIHVHYKGDWGVWRCLAVNIYSPRAFFWITPFSSIRRK